MTFSAKHLCCLITALLVCITAVSCAPRPRRAPAPPIVLTEEQKQVKIVTSTPETNKKLRQNCEVVAVLDGCNATTLRIKAVENGGNVAETICTATQSITTYTQKNYYSNYRVYTPSTDTRTYSSAIIYKCPCEFDVSP